MEKLSDSQFTEVVAESASTININAGKYPNEESISQ
jgi:hypothetical protein